jgi:RNA polymerase sigma factor (sigma-70 family)
MGSNDQDLVRAYALERDADAFAQLVSKYQSLVYNTCMRRLNNSSDAEDVTQEVFLALANHASRVQSENLGGWLYRTAVNAANSKLRRDRTRVERERTRAVPDGQTDKSTEWRQIKEVLDTCLAELPQDSQSLLIERFFLDRTQSELAEMLGVDQATISRRLRKAVDELRRQMAIRGVGLTVAVIAAALTEHASASSVPSNVSIGLTKIGVAGVGSKASSKSSPGWLPALWLTLCAVIAAVVVSAVLLVSGRFAGSTAPTSSVATLARPLPMTTIAELTRLDYSKAISTSEVSMNDQGQIALFNDRPEEQAGVYVIGSNGVRRLRRLPRHERRSLAMSASTFVVANYDGHVGRVEEDAIRQLTESSDVDIPPSVNRRGEVVFVETAPVSRIRLAAGDDIQTLHEAGDQFTRFLYVSINDQGQLAFMADTSRGTRGLFVSDDGALKVIAETGKSFTQLRPWFDFNNLGQAAFVAQQANGTESLYVADGNELRQIARTGDYFASILQASLNDEGIVAFTAKKPDESADLPIAGLYVWDGTQIVELLTPGQQIGGRSLAGALLWRDSLNNADQLAILADFGPNQRSAILRLDVESRSGAVV